MAIKIDAKEHWAFLDEIEAPMWVDLNLEILSTRNQSTAYDSWFGSDHLFHVCSSRQLKAAFAHSSDSFGSPVVESKRPCSPKLPSSVSRSRGKEYAVKRWVGQEQRSMLTVQNQVEFVDKRPLDLNPKAKLEIKSTASSVKARETFRLNKNSTTKMHSRGVGDAKLPHKDMDSTSTMPKKTESKSSNISFKCSQKQHITSQEMSSSHTSASSTADRSSSRLTLRKSCATRPALWVSGSCKEVSVHREPSSGKSSVGSSSSLLAASANYKGRTQGDRSIANEAETIKSKPKVLNVVKAADDAIKSAYLKPIDNVSNALGGCRGNSEVLKRARPLNNANNANKQRSSTSAVVREPRPGKENLYGITTFIRADKKLNPSVSCPFLAKNGDRPRLVGTQALRTEIQSRFAAPRLHFRGRVYLT